MKVFTISILSAVLIFSSCISKKKYVNEQTKVNNLRSDSIGTHSKLGDCNSRVSDLEKEKNRNTKSNAKSFFELSNFHRKF